jgi:DNA mismatch repair protein MutL
MLGNLGEPTELVPTLMSLTDEEAAEGEVWRERLLVNLACRTAVRRGRPLDRIDMRGLIEALGHTNAPAVCPHGSPLLMHVSDSLLQKQFGWS